VWHRAAAAACAFRVLPPAEVQAVKAQVARQERLKFALEKQEVMNEMAKREKTVRIASSVVDWPLGQ